MSSRAGSWLLIAGPALGLPLVLSHSPRAKLVGEVIIFGGAIAVCLYRTLRPYSGNRVVTTEIRWWSFAAFALIFVGSFLFWLRPGDLRMIGDLISLLGYVVMSRALLLRHVGDYQPQHQSK
jgi:hypothetical protein